MTIMSNENSHEKCLRKIDEMRHDLDTVEATIRKDMEIADLKQDNKIDGVIKDVNSGKKVALALGTAVLLSVLYKVLGQIGL